MLKRAKFNIAKPVIIELREHVLREWFCFGFEKKEANKKVSS